jgi:uncharacterized SAM-binding protein YcdF (DUF218 family)
MSRGKRYALLLATVLLFVSLALSHQGILPLALRWLDVGQTPGEADAVFVLLGNADVRPFVAAAIYRRGLVPLVLVAVHDDPLNRDNVYWPPRHLVYKSVLLHRGVPEQDILLLGEGSNSTRDEMEQLATFLVKNPESHVLLVTSHFHTRRARWTLRRQLGHQADRVHVVSSPEDQFNADNWWRSKDGFVLVTMEYIKLAAYWYFYGHGGIVTLGAGVLGMATWWFWPRRLHPVGAEPAT